MGSRTWIKIYCDKWLNGTIREETPELRGIWVDLLVLAGSGRYGDSGEIKITDQVGFLDQQLADLLQISVQKWVACKKKLIETDRVEVGNGNAVVIKNWSKYQSDYKRQKPYRQIETTSHIPNNRDSKSCNQKLQVAVSEVVTKSAARDRDYRLEIIEEESRDTPLNPPTGSLFDPLTEKALKDYEDTIVLPGTLLSAEMKAELLQACQTFSPALVSEAIKEAVKQNQRTWRYIRGILNNWQRDNKGEMGTETQ